MLSVGVLCQSNRAKNSDWPACLHFLNRRFTALTAFSALPLDCGYLGDDVTWSKPQVHVKTENSAEEGCVPLSVTRTSGMPNLAKTALSSFMIDIEVIEVIRATSM